MDQFPADLEAVEEGTCLQCGSHTDEPCDPQCPQRVLIYCRDCGEEKQHGVPCGTEMCVQLNKGLSRE